MTHPTILNQIIEATEAMENNSMQTIPIEFTESPATRVHLNLASACADSARNWREIGIEALRNGNTNLAIFCQQCAWDNERIAEEERGAA